MEHHSKLTSFKHLLKTSKHFLKTNWKKVAYYFLPVQVIIFTSVAVLDLLPEETDSVLIIIVGVVFGLLSFFGAFSLKMLSLGAPLVLKSIEEGESQKNILWYRNIFKKVISMVWIGALISLLNIAFITLILLIAIIIFILPSVIVGILLRFGFVDFAFYFQDLFVNNVTVGITSGLLFIGMIVSSIAFFINSYFSIYAFLLEGRRGLDAVATSFLSVTKRRTKIFWRVVGIWIITAIPFLVLVLPIQGKIIYDALKAMAIEVFLLQIPPALPEVPVGILLAQNALYFIASILSLPIFVTLNYFLWKDVNSTVKNFEEIKYNKTRKWIKIGVWAGAVMVTVIVALTCVAILTFGVEGTLAQ